MAKNHYTADSASPPRLMPVQRRSEVTGSCPVPAVCDGTAGTTFPSPHSSIV